MLSNAPVLATRLLQPVRRVRLDRADGKWALCVANDGPPLPAGAERLFEPMVSLRDARGADVHLGLGLHIVRLIADFHGGRVRAENRPDGQGVAVIIELPAA